MKLKWAFGFPGASTDQPTVSGGRVLVGSSDGSVYSLDAQTGCIHWVFKASSGVRAAISVSADGWEAYVASGAANVYAITTATGALIWKTHVDPHPLACITGAPLLMKGRLYVPVSSGEEGAAINPYYACCTFRGNVVAVDTASGKQIWKAYTIPNAPKPTGKNAPGIPTWGPSGAAVWSRLRRTSAAMQSTWGQGIITPIRLEVILTRFWRLIWIQAGCCGPAR